MGRIPLLPLLLAILPAIHAGATTIVVDGQDPSVKYSTVNGTTPTWWKLQSSQEACDTSQMVTSRFGDYMTFMFTGTGVSIIGSTSAGGGILGFSLDGTETTPYNCSSSSLECGETLYESSAALPYVQHTIVAWLAGPGPDLHHGLMSIQQIRFTTPNQANSHMRTVVIAISTVGGFLLFILTIVAIVYFKSRKGEQDRSRQQRGFFDSDDIPWVHHSSAGKSGVLALAPDLVAEPFVWQGPRSQYDSNGDRMSSTRLLQEGAGEPGSPARGSWQPLLQAVSPPRASHIALQDAPRPEAKGSTSEEQDEEVRRDWLRAHTILVAANPDIDTESVFRVPGKKRRIMRRGTLNDGGASTSGQVTDQNFVNRVAERLADIVLARRLDDNLTQSPPSYLRELDSEREPPLLPPPLPPPPPPTLDHSGRGRQPLHVDLASPPQEREGHDREGSPLLSRQTSSSMRFGPRPMPPPRRSSTMSSSGSTSPRLERRQDPLDVRGARVQAPTSWRLSAGDTPGSTEFT